MNQKSKEEVENRLQALRKYKIMDTPPEQAFDDLTLLASFICHTPISLISLLDKKRQWFKSKIGWTATDTPIEQAFCAQAILEPDIFIVPDATRDPRFAENPLVISEPRIRFYAGAPLVSPEGIALGTLCAIDKKAREISEDQQNALAALARQTVMQLELRRTLRLLTRTLAEKQAALDEVKELKEILPICCYCKKIRDDDNYWHQVDEYISENSEVKFSHGYCPDCYIKSQKKIGKDNVVDSKEET